MFSPASKLVPFGVEDVSMSGVTPSMLPSIEFTAGAHSALRRRKSTFERMNDSITSEPASQVLDAAGKEDADLRDVSHVAALDDDALADCEDDSELATPSLPPLSLLFPLQLILFPLWCAIVGAAILLCPAQLNVIAFPASLSYSSGPASTLRARLLSLAQTLLVRCLPFAAPPSPIRIFAHWATVAPLHVAIFLAALAGVVYLSLPLGALLAAVSVGQFVHAWGDFDRADEDEEGGTEVGGDVRQMLYQILVAPGCGFGEGDVLKRVGDKYFLVRKPRVETRAEILAAAGVEADSDEDGDEAE
ncbi:hypothetical protein B0H19DRAFT_481341 [Mycena capillaripes]|nr:hypothetical protein B0H19DRAFT_481341 [Mycena capillaripes]